MWPGRSGGSPGTCDPTCGRPLPLDEAAAAKMLANGTEVSDKPMSPDKNGVSPDLFSASAPLSVPETKFGTSILASRMARCAEYCRLGNGRIAVAGTT